MKKIPPAARNALWLISGRCLQLLIQLAVGVLTARYLGPGDYGLLHYGTAYTGFFAAVCNLGLQSILVKELTGAPEADGEILGTSLLLRGISSLLSAGVIWCIVSAVDRQEPVAAAVVGLTTLGMVLQLFELFHCWFQWRLQSRVTAAVLLCAGMLSAGYKLVLVLWKLPVSWFALSGAVDQLAAAVLLLAAYRRSGGGKLRISVARGRQLLSRGCPFVLPGLMAAVYAQTDKIMLRQMMGDVQTGLYATAVSLCGVWCFVLSAIIDSAYPGIAQAHSRDRVEFARRNRQLYALVFYLAAAVSLGITVLAEPGVRLLYGDAYLGAVVPLRILTWHTAFSYLGVARNIWIVCENAQKHLLWIYTAGAVSNVGLNLLLIPGLGASGAAVASLVSQIVTALAAPLMIRQLRENAVLMLQAITLGNRKEETP